MSCRRNPHSRRLVLFAEVARFGGGGVAAGVSRTLTVQCPGRDVQVSIGVFADAIDAGPAPSLSGSTWTLTPGIEGEKGGPLYATAVRNAQALPDSWDAGNSPASQWIGVVTFTAASISASANGRALAIA